jgi:hypothetical protein
MSTDTERVAAGMAFLDEREPGWPSRIDLGRLNIADPDWCMTGQLQPATSHAWAGICRAAGWEADAGGADDISLGFDAEEAAEYSALTAEWRRAITERLAAP